MCLHSVSMPGVLTIAQALRTAPWMSVVNCVLKVRQQPQSLLYLLQTKRFHRLLYYPFLPSVRLCPYFL